MERLIRLSPHHALDNYFRLHYGREGSQRLHPCKPIGDADLHLGIIDNNHLNPHRLMLLGKDREIIRVNIPETGKDCKIRLPGKSAIICLTLENCGPELVRQMVINELAGQPDRRDHLHIATVGQIREVGWVPYWAPLQLERKVLHARLVAKRTIESGEEPTEDDTRALVEAFTKAS